MTYHIDFATLLATIAAVLLMVGVIPFTPVGVGAIILLAQCELKLTWVA